MTSPAGRRRARESESWRVSQRRGPGSARRLRAVAPTFVLVRCARGYRVRCLRATSGSDSKTDTEWAQACLSRWTTSSVSLITRVRLCQQQSAAASPLFGDVEGAPVLPRVVNARCRQPRRWFGTKRPQVQILPPRPVFPQARGPHQIRGLFAISTAAKYGKYSNDNSPVSQQQQGIWAFRIGPPLRQPLSAGDEHRATRPLTQDDAAGFV